MNGQQSGPEHEGMLDAAAVRTLIELQAMDDRRAELADKKKRRPRLLEEKNQELAAAKKRAEDAHVLVQDAQKAVDRLGVESKSLLDDVKRLEGQLFGLKTNAEFEAMKHQIARKKEDASKVQDKALEIMLSMDDLKAAHAAAVSDVKKCEAEVERIEGLIQSELDRISDELSTLEEKRRDIAARLDEELLSLYEDIHSRRDGKGIALIEDEICLGCDTRVTPNIVGNLIKGRLEQCPHCDRIIYVMRTG